MYSDYQIDGIGRTPGFAYSTHTRADLPNVFRSAEQPVLSPLRSSEPPLELGHARMCAPASNRRQCRHWSGSGSQPGLVLTSFVGTTPSKH